MKKFLVIAASLATLLFGTAGCQKDPHLHMEDADTPQSVYVWTRPGKPVESNAGIQAVTIYATSDWTAESEASWISVDPASGSKGPNEVILTYSANNTGSPRTGVVVFKAGDIVDTFTLSQK